MTAFDPFDVFKAAAVWCCCIICDFRDADLEFVPAGDGGLDYYHALGQNARQFGWSIADVSSAVEPAYRIACPSCAAAHGGTRPDMFPPARPPDAVRAICDLACRPGEMDAPVKPDTVR